MRSTTWLHEDPTQFDSMDELARFLNAVVLGHRFEWLPERGEPVVDYVRLNILAKREVGA